LNGGQIDNYTMGRLSRRDDCGTGKLGEAILGLRPRPVSEQFGLLRTHRFAALTCTFVQAVNVDNLNLPRDI
jgi:hypothetical protein